MKWPRVCDDDLSFQKQLSHMIVYSGRNRYLQGGEVKIFSIIIYDIPSISGPEQVLMLIKEFKKKKKINCELPSPEISLVFTR